MKIKTTAFRNNYPAAIMILIILISSFTGRAQTLDGKFYQPIVPPYSWQSGWFKTNLNIPKSAATTGRDTGAIYYKFSDSSIYVWSGTAWLKVGSGSGGSQSLQDVTDIGTTTTNNFSHIAAANPDNYAMVGDDAATPFFEVYQTASGGQIANLQPYRLTFATPSFSKQILAGTISSNRTLTLPDKTGIISVDPKLTSVSTNTTVTVANDIYLVSTPSADVTMTVNPANFYSSGVVTVLRFKKVTNNAYTVIISPTSGSINGASSYSMGLFNESVTIISDGTNLYTF